MNVQFYKKNINMLPYELVDLIADYHDYDKYCKPDHIQKYNSVLEDIIDMGNIMHTISPNIALQCWGSKAHLLGETSYEFVGNDDMVGLYSDDDQLEGNYSDFGIDV